MDASFEIDVQELEKFTRAVPNPINLLSSTLSTFYLQPYHINLISPTYEPSISHPVDSLSDPISTRIHLIPEPIIPVFTSLEIDV